MLTTDVKKVQPEPLKDSVPVTEQKVDPLALATNENIPEDLASQLAQFQNSGEITKEEAADFLKNRDLHLSDINDLGRSIADYKAKGMEFEVIPGLIENNISSSRESENSKPDQLEIVSGIKDNNSSEKISVAYAHNVKEDIDIQLQAQSELDPLLRTVTKGQIRPYTIDSGKISDQVGFVRVINNLNIDNPVVVELLIPLAQSDLRQDVPNAIATEITEHFSKNREELEGTVEFVAPTSEVIDPAVRVRLDKPMSAEQRELFEKVLGEYDLKFGVIPNGVKSDYQGFNLEMGNRRALFVYPLSGEKLKELGYPTVEITGGVEFVSLSGKVLRPTPSFENINSSELTAQGRVSYHSGNIPFSFRRDQILDLSPKENYEDGVSESRPIELSLDKLGSKYQDKVLGGVLFQTGMPKIMEVGEYGVFSRVIDSTIQERIRRDAPQITQGAKNTEELFGFQEGEVLQNIEFVLSERKNAYFDNKNSSTIGVQLTDSTSEENYEEFKNIGTGTHETIHLIDEWTQGKLSGGVLKAHFDGVKARDSRFLEIISEDNFQGEGFGGHAYDNKEEYLASLLTTLSDPNWEYRIRELPVDFRVEYQLGLKALDQNLRNIPEISAAAPIRTLLKERIEVLDTMTTLKDFRAWMRGNPALDI